MPLAGERRPAMAGPARPSFIVLVLVPRPRPRLFIVRACLSGSEGKESRLRGRGRGTRTIGPLFGAARTDRSAECPPAPGRRHLRSLLTFPIIAIGDRQLAADTGRRPGPVRETPGARTKGADTLWVVCHAARGKFRARPTPEPPNRCRPQPRRGAAKRLASHSVLLNS